MLHPQLLLDSIKAAPAGGTIPITGTLPTDGYFVALPIGGFGLPLDFSTLRHRNAEAAENLLILCDPGTPAPRMFIGWWTDESVPTGPLILVEPVVHVQTLPDALTLGRILAQQCVYSIAESSCIPVEPT